LEKGLALRAERSGLLDAIEAKSTRCGLAYAELIVVWFAPLVGICHPVRNNRPAQNWCGQEESDCLIKTKHCDKQKCFLRNVISAQCSECHCDEIRPSAGKRRE
jgi:hypothetical protein